MIRNWVDELEVKENDRETRSFQTGKMVVFHGHFKQGKMADEQIQVVISTIGTQQQHSKALQIIEKRWNVTAPGEHEDKEAGGFFTDPSQPYDLSDLHRIGELNGTLVVIRPIYNGSMVHTALSPNTLILNDENDSNVYNILPIKRWTTRYLW